jgi:hypothetical protein
MFSVLSYFLPGLINTADFFTKILPVYRHIAALLFPSWHPLPSSTPTPFCCHPLAHHTPPPSTTFQSPQSSPRQGPLYLSLPLTQPHFVLPIPVPMPACNASNKPSLPPCSSSTPLRREPNAPDHPGPTAECWFQTFLYLAFILAFVLA